MDVFIFIGVVLNSVVCSSLFVKISINDLQALNSIQLTKLTVFYTANMHEVSGC